MSKKREELANFAVKKDPALRKEVEIEKPVFDIQFQAGLLKICLDEDYFCSQLTRYLASDNDLEEYIVFDNPQFHHIFKLIHKSLEEFKCRPSIAQLRQQIANGDLAEDEKEPFFEALKQIQEADVNNDEYFRKYMTTFVQQVKMAKGFKKTRKLWQEHPADAPVFLQGVIDGINRVQFEKEDVLKLSDLKTLTKERVTEGSKIPTGLTKLDFDMRGGLPRQSLVTVLGASNAGKSIFCTSLGSSAVRAGFRVFHINLEGAREEAVYRYASNLGDVSFADCEELELMKQLISDPVLLERDFKERLKSAHEIAETDGTEVEFFKTVVEYKKDLEKRIIETEKANDKVINEFEDKLVIRNMLNFGMTIEDVISVCRETYKTFPFDMLIVDYGQLLGTKERMEKFDKQTAVYRGLDTLSKEFNCVVVTPAQSTREGLRKQNEHQSSSRRGTSKLPVLRSDDMADCIEIARVSAVIITLNRTPEEEERGWVRVFLEKQRRGRKSITYGIKAKYENSNLIINDYYSEGDVIHTAKDKEDEEENVTLATAGIINSEKMRNIDPLVKSRLMQIRDEKTYIAMRKEQGRMTEEDKDKLIELNEEWERILGQYGLTEAMAQKIASK